MLDLRFQSRQRLLDRHLRTHASPSSRPVPAPSTKEPAVASRVGRGEATACLRPAARLRNRGRRPCGGGPGLLVNAPRLRNPAVSQPGSGERKPTGRVLQRRAAGGPGGRPIGSIKAAIRSVQAGRGSLLRRRGTAGPSFRNGVPAFRSAGPRFRRAVAGRGKPPPDPGAGARPIRSVGPGGRTAGGGLCCVDGGFETGERLHSKISLYQRAADLIEARLAAPPAHCRPAIEAPSSYRL
jgi:hypothetical protein